MAKAKKAQNPREMIEQIRKKELEYCRSNPIYFCDTYGHIEDKDAPDHIIKLDMWPKQREAMQQIVDNRLTVILKARQLGVTWLALIYAAWVMLTPGKLVIALSRTEEEAKELVRRLGVIFSAIPELNVKVKPTAMDLTVSWDDGISTFKAFPSASGAARSFTANLLILDEWAFQAAAEQIWMSTFPTINRPTGGQVIGLSTIDRGTLFEKIFIEATEGKNGFCPIFLPWDADPRRGADWHSKTMAALGDLITQEYPATIAEALTIPGGSFFPEFRRHIHIKPPIIDTAGYRRYICLDYGLDMLSVLWVMVDREHRARVYREHHASNIIIPEACKIIRRLTGNEAIDLTLAPPDLWNRDQVHGKSRALFFQEGGVPLTQTSNDVDAGCAAIKQWLSGDNPALTFDDGIVTVTAHITKIQRDKNKPNRYAKEPHILTHAVDALRCFCIYWTAPAETPTQEQYFGFSALKPTPSPVGYGERMRVV
jgi:hypothetical protein